MHLPWRRTLLYFTIESMEAENKEEQDGKERKEEYKENDCLTLEGRSRREHFMRS